jgi:hypothetical protein
VAEPTDLPWKYQDNVLQGELAVARYPQGFLFTLRETRPGGQPVMVRVPASKARALGLHLVPVHEELQRMREALQGIVRMGLPLVEPDFDSVDEQIAAMVGRARRALAGH